MKIDTPPFDRFNATLEKAKNPRDLFGDNPPKNHLEIVGLLKSLRELRNGRSSWDMITHMSLDKLENFLEWAKYLVLFARFGKSNPKPECNQEYRLKLVIKVQEFEGKKMFRLDHASKNIFFTSISAQSLQGLWWHDQYEIHSHGTIIHSGVVMYKGTRDDCNAFIDSQTNSDKWHLHFLPDEFELGEEIHIYTVQYQTVWQFLTQQG